MEDNQFEKRMELLKKSYDRMPSSFDSEKTMRKIQEESEPAKRKGSQFKQRATVWAVSIASVFIIGILSAAFFLTDEREQADNIEGESIDELLPQLEALYNEERKKKREMLKMDKKNFSSLSFVQLADSAIGLMKSDKNLIRLSNKNSSYAKESLEELLELSMLELKLPSEMIEELIRNPSEMGEVESIEFMATYRDKVNALINGYDEIILKSEEMDEELQPIIKAMEQQHLVLVETGLMGELEATYGGTKEDNKIRESLHEHVRGYYNMLVDEPYMIGADIQDPIEVAVERILDMQKTLIAVEQDGNLYPVMKGYFKTMLYGIVGGLPRSKIVDDARGIVRPEVQNVWKQLAEGDRSLPTVYLMKPFIEEMEASGWKASKSLDYFIDPEEIEMALERARN